MNAVSLTLEVVSAQAASLGAQCRHIVGPDGTIIGRGPVADWNLPSIYLAQRHAYIFFDDGQFFIESWGQHPVAIGRRDNALRFREPHALKIGDRIFITEYEVLVREGGPTSTVVRQ
jgi:predicted component of type VI protein secretion system